MLKKIARFKTIAVVALWLGSLLPGMLVSMYKGDPFGATLIVMLIQFLASFGSITLFGVIAQVLLYHNIDSIEVHDAMMDGLFIGFHSGMAIWIVYGFYHILFGRKIIGEINTLISMFSGVSLASCVAGMLIGYVVGRVRDAKGK